MEFDGEAFNGVVLAGICGHAFTLSSVGNTMGLKVYVVEKFMYSAKVAYQQGFLEGGVAI